MTHLTLLNRIRRYINRHPDILMVYALTVIGLGMLLSVVFSHRYGNVRLY